jgi:RNA polymerase sigma factor (TIGR02999 family)
MGANASLTERLQMFMQGDVAAADDLLREVMPKLRDIALRQLRLERCVAPFTKTELINELWLTSLSKGGWQIRDQGHFYALASLAMRRVLIGLARKRLAVCRGGGQTTLPLDDLGPLLGASIKDTERIVDIGILMDRLEVEDPDGARMVDMHYFSGFTLEEIAQETGLTLKQVRSRWEKGMKWLKRRLYSKRQKPPLFLRDQSV